MNILIKKYANILALTLLATASHYRRKIIYVKPYRNPQHAVGFFYFEGKISKTKRSPAIFINTIISKPFRLVFFLRAKNDGFCHK